MKIDGAFVQNIVKSADDRAFVHTLIDLSHRLGLKTVAEWVQDEEAALLLSDWGCDCLHDRAGQRSAGVAGRKGRSARLMRMMR